MLRIKSVTARNFLSIGAQTQAVNFDTGSLTLVIGHNQDLGGDGSRNGVGKTAILNALSYGIYGDALTSIKKDNLINLTNKKNMLVTVDFEINNVNYRIERGRKPALLKFYIDGAEGKHDDGQGENRETQKHIEHLVGFSHEMFKHIVALNTYTQPFLSMRAGDQRNMIEHLLGITDLSEKAEILGKLLKSTKELIKEEEIKISAVTASNERIEKNIQEIKLRGQAWLQAHNTKINEMNLAIDTLLQIEIDVEIENHNNNTIIQKQINEIKVLGDQHKQFSESLMRSDAKLLDLKNSLKSAWDGVCPACGQNTAHLDTHENYITGLEQKISDEIIYNQEVSQNFTKIDDQYLNQITPVLNETFYDTLEAALSHKHNLKTLQDQLSDKNQEQNPYTEQIESLKNTGIENIDYTLINELTVLQDHQEFLLKLLTNKDSFIRRKIINQNISFLNHRLEYYLEKMGLPHTVQFMSDLNVEISEYGRELDFDNLSRGERNRLILSLSWAFRDIYESLNQPMNLMCVDELIDSGLDQSGVENALAVLKKMNRDQNKNVMLVSHREELIGRVSDILTVIKTNGFTEYHSS